MATADTQFQQALKQLCGASLRCHESLIKHSRWRIGGLADFFVEPASVAEIAAIVKLCNNSQVPLIVIGEGSNLLFDDQGVRGIVLKIGNKLSAVSINDKIVHAQAGIWIPHLALLTARKKLRGLEHTIGIPGTLGGLVLMNGGSQRQAIGSHIKTVQIVTADGCLAEWTAAECQFSYRHSSLQGSDHIIVAAQLCLDKGNYKESRKLMLEDLRQRRKKFPLKLPNCGSVFLSSEEMHKVIGPPGKVIEDAGLKGFSIGGAQVSPCHANFIVNTGGATSGDVVRLIEYVRSLVFERYHYHLETEVRYVAPDGVQMPVGKISENSG